MVGTILPMVDRERLVCPYARSLWYHAAGSLAGGMMCGAGLSALGNTMMRLTPTFSALPTVLVAIGGILMLSAIRELRLSRLRLPESHWQVPAAWWSRDSKHVVALVWGLILGAGVLTRITGSAFYAAACGVFLLSDVTYGALVLGIFGVARVLPLYWLEAARDPVRIGRRVEELARRRRPLVLLSNGLCLAGLGGWLVIGMGLNLMR